jgi:hypothetical protein
VRDAEQDAGVTTQIEEKLPDCIVIVIDIAANGNQVTRSSISNENARTVGGATTHNRCSGSGRAR